CDMLLCRLTWTSLEGGFLAPTWTAPRSTLPLRTRGVKPRWSAGRLAASWGLPVAMAGPAPGGILFVGPPLLASAPRLGLAVLGVRLIGGRPAVVPLKVCTCRTMLGWVASTVAVLALPRSKRWLTRSLTSALPVVLPDRMLFCKVVVAVTAEPSVIW